MLCYNKECNMLYHANSAPTADVLFHCYEDKGFKESENIYVGETGFSFVIRSNFGYGNASYLQFRATYNTCKLYDYEAGYQKENWLPIFKFEPNPDNWDKLFCKIEEVFIQRESWNCNSLTKFLIWFDSEFSNHKEEELEKKPNLIVGQISTALHDGIARSMSFNPMLKPLLIKMCKVGLKIIRKKTTGDGFLRLSEENRKKGMDTIYDFLKEINHEYLLFE